ncbi:MAG: TOBE domain-containing protein [Methanobrevibacter sp.]|nr:TOBE domain-containing protein [Methanobrevibacter sp.]
MNAEGAYKININNKVYVIDKKKYEIIDKINILGSISCAAKSSGVSYRTALNYIEKIENELDIKLVKTKKGGKGGGGSTELSREGKTILKKCKIISAVMELSSGINEIKTTISSIDEEKKIMALEKNDFKIFLPLNENYNVGDEILALIKYDNIFILLNKCEISVRNIFKGEIIEMRVKNEMFRISVDIGSFVLRCDITKPASDELGLSLGKNVYIGFKATSIATLKENRINN